MSKNNNMNPGQYEGNSNRQGDGILQDEEKQRLKESEKREGKEGERNFIPGEEPAGEKSDR